MKNLLIGYCVLSGTVTLLWCLAGYQAHRAKERERQRQLDMAEHLEQCAAEEREYQNAVDLEFAGIVEVL